jgi:hypothetical protein
MRRAGAIGARDCLTRIALPGNTSIGHFDNCLAFYRQDAPPLRHIQTNKPNDYSWKS